MDDEIKQRYQNASPEEFFEEIDRQHDLYLSATEDGKYYRDALAYIYRTAQDWRWNRPSSESDLDALKNTMQEIMQKAFVTLRHDDRYKSTDAVQPETSKEQRGG